MISIVGRISLNQIVLQTWLLPDSSRISSPVQVIKVSASDVSGNIYQEFQSQLFQRLGDGVVGFVHCANVEISRHKDGLVLDVVDPPLENVDQLSLVTLGRSVDVDANHSLDCHLGHLEVVRTENGKGRILDFFPVSEFLISLLSFFLV